MISKNVLFIFICAICNNLSAQIIDTLTQNHYYSNEIISDDYLDIYNKWNLTDISGGISGGGYEPDLDDMEIMKYGIYKLYRNDSLLHFGKIEIEEEDSNSLLINFVKDTGIGNIMFYDMIKYVYVNDSTLTLNSPCCDRFNYHFKKDSTSTAITIIKEIQNFQIFPIPAKDIIRIDLSNRAIKNHYYEIYNANGQIVDKAALNNLNINVSNLSNGIYIIRIIGDMYTYSEKIIINKNAP
ncbi:MAG: T9SS type A sorting domain-containing protein [Bacteroidia bacterium]|nr:T9SS type A sorting domain-containing protein [Bacteroidia bacterium]